MQLPNGVSRVRELNERHSPSVESDYSTEIVDELVRGKLVIVDQSIGSPSEIEHTSERIMWELFNRQKQVFTNPLRDKEWRISSVMKMEISNHHLISSCMWRRPTT